MTQRRAETKSRAALKVWTVFGVSRIWSLSWPVVRKDRSTRANKGGKKQAGQRTRRMRMRRLEWDGILYTVILKEISKHPQQQQLLQALYFLFPILLFYPPISSLITEKS